MTWVGPALLAGTLALAAGAAAQDANRVVIEGTVKRGDEFTRTFGPGFTFALKGKDAWEIVITHAAAGGKDLIYPVNPPYRFSNQQSIGPGYGETARDSARNTPREFGFLYRPGDFEQAWNDLERVLWPYGSTAAEVERATDELARLPTGRVKVELLTAEFAASETRPGEAPREGVVALKFRATITWPGP